MNVPKYTIIIPTLNEEKFLPNLLESLVHQTLKDFEVIVVDGKSKDKTVAVARTYAEKLSFLQIITASKASLPFQRNLGATGARGLWYIFVDADSIFLPNFIERICQYIQDENPLFFTTWFRPDTEEVGDSMLTLLTNLMLEGSIMFKRPLSPGPLTLVRKDIYDLVGGYDETHTFHEDMDFSLRIAKHGVTLHILRETLCILSLRRLRNQGKLNVIQQYIRSAIPVLFLNRPMKNMPGYIMGGQLYDRKQKPIKRSVLRKYEVRLKKLMKEIFG